MKFFRFALPAKKTANAPSRLKKFSEAVKFFIEERWNGLTVGNARIKTVHIATWIVFMVAGYVAGLYFFC